MHGAPRKWRRRNHEANGATTAERDGHAALRHHHHGRERQRQIDGGAKLADELGCSFLEGDLFHAPASIAKMRSGQPLADPDRWPWLDRVGSAIRSAGEADAMTVAACSALKRTHRERLAQAAHVPLFFVLLDAHRHELERRMISRPGHYMPASLLASQLAALERPGADERAPTLDARQSPDELLEAAWAWMLQEIAHHYPASR